MKSYGFEMYGPLVLEILDELPEWEPSFEGRVIYDKTTSFVYIATDLDWEHIGNGGNQGIPDIDLNDLDDVSIEDSSDGQVLTKSGSEWVNANLPTPDPGVQELSDLDDVNVDSVSLGQVLAKVSGGWGPRTIPEHDYFKNLIGVLAAAPTTGQYLVFNGEKWAATTVTGFTDTETEYGRVRLGAATQDVRSVVWLNGRRISHGSWTTIPI